MTKAAKVHHLAAFFLWISCSWQISAAVNVTKSCQKEGEDLYTDDRREGLNAVFARFQENPS
jgi:hypothetical protein